MTRATLAAALFLGLGSTAPLQCTKEPDPALRREETADEALYHLSEDFAAHGNDEASRHTLEVLVAKYPSSRFAPDARTKLGVSDAGAD